MSTVVVIPCYNEANRLDTAQVRELLGACDAQVWFVDDGSSDGTASMLRDLASGDQRIRVLCLERNSGKAEAVRVGLRAAVDSGASLVAFTDADFATPPEELARLLHIAAEGGNPVVIGSRVALLGHRIERQPLRHYTGRVFATISGIILGFTVYDTQCGAKVFASTDTLRRALEQPFIGRWSFDVELLGRLAAPAGTAGFLEVPLHEWRDVGGSKLSLGASARSTLELLAVRRALRRYRLRVSPQTAR